MRKSFHSELKIGVLMLCPLSPIPQKLTMVVTHLSGGDTIPIISSFPGCGLFTPFIGYAGNPHVIHQPRMI